MSNNKSTPVFSAFRRALTLAALSTTAMVVVPAFAVETACVASGGANCAALIPDGPQSGVVSTLTVPAGLCGAATPTSVSVRVNATHSWIGDLSITVTNPASQTVTLINQLPSPPSTSCAGDDVSATFSDGGAAPSCAAAVVPSLSGTIAPAAALAPLTASVAGLWTLTVTDNVNGNNGALNDWAVDVGCVVLPPADMAVVLSGFPSNPTPNSPASGTVTCTNIGGQAATNVTCSVVGGTTSACTLQPANTPVASFPVATVVAGESITCNVATTASPTGQLNVTGLTSAANDGNAANNTALFAAVSAQPVLVPTLSSVTLALLALLLAGFAALRLGGRRA